MYYLIFTIICFVVATPLFLLSRGLEVDKGKYISSAFGWLIIVVWIVGIINMPPPSFNVIHITPNGFDQDNVNSSSVGFMNTTNKPLVLCLAQHWQCDPNLSDWCESSYFINGWVNDWFPSAFSTCMNIQYVEISPYQQVTLSFPSSDLAYEIIIKEHPAMKLVLTNPSHPLHFINTHDDGGV